MDLSAATELYLLERARVPLFLVPDSAGTPTVIHPQPLLFRATYLSAHDLETETGIQRAGSELEKSNCPLFAPMPCPDGPPYRTGLLFVHTKRMNGVPWQDGSMIRHGDAMLLYQPTTMQAQWDWIGDARMGRYGYFLTGTVGDSSLWRLFRLESDAFFRSIFTLVRYYSRPGARKRILRASQIRRSKLNSRRNTQIFADLLRRTATDRR